MILYCVVWPRHKGTNTYILNVPANFSCRTWFRQQLEKYWGSLSWKKKILVQLLDPQMVIHAPPELCYMLSLWLMPSIFTNSPVPEAEMASHTIRLLPLCLTVGRSLHLPPSNLYTLCCQTAQTQTHECTTDYTNFSLTICCALLKIADSIFLI